MPSDAVLADLRAALEVERDALAQQLADLGAGDYDSNFADSSQVTAERGEAEALPARSRERLDEVEHALSKVDGGTFGTCEKCGNPIAAGPARGHARRPVLHRLRLQEPLARRTPGPAWTSSRSSRTSCSCRRSSSTRSPTAPSPLASATTPPSGPAASR